ncbi:hypothetical protein ACLOJK_028828 [Asimina triloba]
MASIASLPSHLLLPSPLALCFPIPAPSPSLVSLSNVVSFPRVSAFQLPSLSQRRLLPNSPASLGPLPFPSISASTSSSLLLPSISASAALSSSAASSSSTTSSSSAADVVIPSSSSLISTDLPPFPLHFRSSALSPPFPIFLPFLSLSDLSPFPPPPPPFPIFLSLSSATIDIGQGLLSPIFLYGLVISPFPYRRIFLAVGSASPPATYLLCLAVSHLPGSNVISVLANMLVSGLIVMFEKIKMI